MSFGWKKRLGVEYGGRWEDVCVCVCVCVYERERGKKVRGKSEVVLHAHKPYPLSANHF